MIDERYVTYDFKYEGDTLPSDEKYGYSNNTSGNSSSTIENGILHLQSFDKGTCNGWFIENNITDDNIILIKTRGKCLKGRLDICDICYKNSRCSILVYPDKIIINGITSFNFNGNVWHDYFVIKNKNISQSLYIDGEYIGTYPLQIESNYNKFAFGSNSTGYENQDVYIDYFYYNSNFNKDKLESLYHYLIKNIDMYYSLKDDYIKDNNFTPLQIKDIKEFKQYSFDNLNKILKLKEYQNIQIPIINQFNDKFKLLIYKEE